MTAIMAGENFAWPSPSVPKLLEQNITREECSYIAVSAPIGMVLGGPIAGYMVDAIGRKQTIFLVGFPQLLSLILIYFYHVSKYLLYLARFIGGLGESGVLTVMSMYIAEVSSPKIRGVLGSYMSLTVRIGMLSINIVGSYFSIKTTSLIFMVFPVIFMVIFYFMPESPYYLIKKNNISEAKKSLIFLRRTKHVDVELNGVIKAVERQTRESGKLEDLFTIESNKKALFIALALRTIDQFSGASAFGLYTQVLFAQAIDNFEPHVAAIIYSTINVFVTLLCSFAIDKVGRKPLLLLSCTSCAAILLIEAIFFTLRDYVGCDVSSIKYVPLIGMVAFIIFYAFGMGTVINVMLGELFSQSVRGKALCLLNMYFGANILITTKVFQAVSDRIGLSVPFFIFAACTVVGCFFCWKYVPETKNKTLEQIQLEMKNIAAGDVQDNAENATVKYSFKNS